MPERRVIEYLERDGSSPFGKWFTRLNAKAGAKVATALYRLERAICRTLNPSAKVCSSIESISAQAIESILDKKATPW